MISTNSVKFCCLDYSADTELKMALGSNFEEMNLECRPTFRKTTKVLGFPKIKYRNQELAITKKQHSHLNII